LVQIQRDTEADAGPRDKAARLERLCIATRTVKSVAEMIRFVAGPDGTVVPDIRRNLPGRGVWVTRSREALAEAIRRNAFARGFKRPVRTPADLVELTGLLLENAALDALSIAHKAGLVVTGFAKVETALTRSDIAALIHAADAAADGVRKLTGAARRRADHGTGPLPIVTEFSSVQLDLALGRSNVIHAALLAGPASESFLARCRRLQEFRSADPGSGIGGQCGP
jgi:uncharacterized protein